MSSVMRSDLEIPVYLFTGFLESGKTKFIQGVLEDKTFGTDERTLLLVCEEGEEEYDPTRFRGRNTFMRTVENEEDLTEDFIRRLYAEKKFDRMVVEYNGMWMLDTLYRALPQQCVVYQEFMLADTTTFENYNANMRQLVYDKLRSCQLAVFNRFPKGMDCMPIHRIVRAVNRRCDIAYEDIDGNARYDDIEDPLPFDKNADIIEISDKDYALWYRDLSEALKSYDGKKLRYKAMVNRGKNMPDDTVVVGRPLMNCCAADTTFAGLVATDFPQNGPADGTWVTLTAQLKVRRHPLYGKAGPVLTVLDVTPAEAPENPVATFY